MLPEFSVSNLNKRPEASGNWCTLELRRRLVTDRKNVAAAAAPSFVIETI